MNNHNFPSVSWASLCLYCGAQRYDLSKHGTVDPDTLACPVTKSLRTSIDSARGRMTDVAAKKAKANASDERSAQIQRQMRESIIKNLV